VFPRVVYWDDDARKDLLVGHADGSVLIFLNVATDEAPAFDAGTYLQVGPPGEKVDINVGPRATPIVVDWNGDGRRDLVSGTVDGTIRIYINEGTDTEPDYLEEIQASMAKASLVVISGRSSPVVMDLNGDGKIDILSGNTEGQIVFYPNVGTAEAPMFGDYIYVEADGVVIDHEGMPRSRPFICDWTGDGTLDLLYGAGCGEVHLHQGIALTGDVNGDGVVDVLDLLLVIAAWGNPGGPEDVNDDGIVDVLDLLEVIAHWS
jgi:hypothetical protein